MTEAGERKFRALLEDAFDIVTVVNLDGTIRHGVPAFESVLGYSPDDLEGRPIFDLVHPADRPLVRSEFERSLERSGPSETIEARFLAREGGVRVLRGRGRSFVDDPEVRGILLTMRDVTAEREGTPVEPAPDRLVVRHEGSTAVVPVSRIDWIEAAGGYACLHEGTRTHVARESLDRLTERLETAGFARIHRSTIVNLRRVREVVTRRYGDRTVVLEDGTRLRMSRTYRAAVEERLEGRG